MRVVEGGSQITEVSDVKGTLDHLDYVAKLVGIDHVALGTDIDMRRPDYTNILSQLVSGLVERGYRREDIRKILSGNFSSCSRQPESRCKVGLPRRPLNPKCRDSFVKSAKVFFSVQRKLDHALEQLLGGKSREIFLN